MERQREKERNETKEERTNDKTNARTLLSIESFMTRCYLYPGQRYPIYAFIRYLANSASDSGIFAFVRD